MWQTALFIQPSLQPEFSIWVLLLHRLAIQRRQWHPWHSFSFMQKWSVINQKLGIYNLCIVRLPALISIERGRNGHWTWGGPNMSALMHHIFNQWAVFYLSCCENAALSLWWDQKICQRKIILFLFKNTAFWYFDEKRNIYTKKFWFLVLLVLVKREWLQFFLEIAIATQILEFDGKQIRSAS